MSVQVPGTSRLLCIETYNKVSFKSSSPVDVVAYRIVKGSTVKCVVGRVEAAGKRFGGPVNLLPSRLY